MRENWRKTYSWQKREFLENFEANVDAWEMPSELHVGNAHKGRQKKQTHKKTCKNLF